MGARPQPSTPIRLVGRAPIAGREVARSIEPERGLRVLTALPEADLAVRAEPGRVTLQPGSQAVVNVTIERRHGFAGRVPLEARNLPFGVRVLDVGLNGVLITESETRRQFTLVAEPWVAPQEREILVVATIEADPAPQVAAEPVVLRITGRQAGR